MPAQLNTTKRPDKTEPDDTQQSGITIPDALVRDITERQDSTWHRDIWTVRSGKMLRDLTTRD